MKLQKKGPELGFTLIETIIIVVIISFVAVMLVTYFGKGIVHRGDPVTVTLLIPYNIYVLITLSAFLLRVIARTAMVCLSYRQRRHNGSLSGFLCKQHNNFAAVGLVSEN